MADCYLTSDNYSRVDAVTQAEVQRRVNLQRQGVLEMGTTQICGSKIVELEEEAIQDDSERPLKLDTTSSKSEQTDAALDPPNFQLFKANRVLQGDRVQIKALRNYKAMAKAAQKKTQQ